MGQAGGFSAFFAFLAATASSSNTIIMFDLVRCSESAIASITAINSSSILKPVCTLMT